MNTHEYELIGESIWNTYKSLGKLLFETKKKSKFKEIAQRLCPDIRVTLKTCDAFLISLYGLNNEER